MYIGFQLGKKYLIESLLKCVFLDIGVNLKIVY